MTIFVGAIYNILSAAVCVSCNGTDVEFHQSSPVTAFAWNMHWLSLPDDCPRIYFDLFVAFLMMEADFVHSSSTFVIIVLSNVILEFRRVTYLCTPFGIRSIDTSRVLVCALSVCVNCVYRRKQICM